jgi:hypothetical protein
VDVASASNVLLAPPRKPIRASVVLVYQDSVAQQQAREFWARVTQLVGDDAARCVSWSVGDLSDPGLLGKAAAATIQAEVIIVAVPEAGTLSPPLCRWIDVWLPLRRQREGVLMGVISLAGPAASSSNHTQEYLRGVARRGGMEFILQEHVAARTPALAGAG